MLNTITQVLASDFLQFLSRSINVFNIRPYGVFPGRYLENERSEDASYTHFFDVHRIGDLSIKGVFRQAFHRE